MLTFTITKGEIASVAGTPDLVFQSKDFEKFKQNLSSFEQKFPDAIFGCVEDVSATYNLSDETRVPLDELEDAGIGVYFGIKDDESSV